MKNQNNWRILRGGAWHSTPAYLGSAYCAYYAVNFRDINIGFRLVQEEKSNEQDK